MYSKHQWLRYLKFIEACDSQDYLATNYEKHHIIPKSLGGSNEQDNIIKLTPRQHFIAHVMLTKATNNPKMYYALIRLSYGQRYLGTISSKNYEMAKLIYSQIEVSKETRQKMSEAKKGIPSPSSRERMKDSKGRKALRYDSRKLWFYNQAENKSVFCTRWDAKQYSNKLFNCSTSSVKRMYCNKKDKAGKTFPWVCLSCFI